MKKRKPLSKKVKNCNEHNYWHNIFTGVIKCENLCLFVKNLSGAELSPPKHVPCTFHQLYIVPIFVSSDTSFYDCTYFLRLYIVPEHFFTANYRVRLYFFMVLEIYRACYKLRLYFTRWHERMNLSPYNNMERRFVAGKSVTNDQLHCI